MMRQLAVAVLAAVGAAMSVENSLRLSRRSLLAIPLVASPIAARAAGSIFADPSSRFALTVPSNFVATKRTASQGTLFVAGDFPRAAVVSVTAWPLSELLLDDAKARSLPGMPAEALRSAAPTSLSDIAPAGELAKLLARQRDREQGGGLISEVVSFSADGGRLLFELATELPVANPDELEKQRGIRRLIRRTAAVALLGSVPGASGPATAVVSAWASCLSQDWEGDLGSPLRESADSFAWVSHK